MKLTPTTETDPDLKIDSRLLIQNTIDAYFRKYTKSGRFPIRPGIKSSTVTTKYVYLRSGNHLLAIYNLDAKMFVNLKREFTPKKSAACK